MARKTTSRAEKPLFNNIPNHDGAGTFEPIAVIGMAMRLPGGVHDPSSFWDLLVNKRSGICDVPADRFNPAAFTDPSGKTTGTFKPQRGYFLNDVALHEFDTSVFPIGKKELERLDPAQRQLLEVAYECLENAGVKDWRGSNTGCYIGVFGEDWQDICAKETQNRGGYRVTGYGDFVLGNRISYELDLQGPSMTIKTACSSSLVGLDTACRALAAGECTAALVGGSSLMFSPTMTLALGDQQMLAPDGICKTFDASADGYGRGEAVNCVYIKTLSQALRDGDTVRAVIRATSVNCDGKTNGMTNPSAEAQERLIRRAYHIAGISDLGETAVVECHGTGTQAGDPQETGAVAKAFGEKGVIITSVKPNVGHSEGAAGLTSLIKSVLALERRLVPPQVYFSNPNPKIPFKECRLHVPTKVEAWPAGRAERMSVNSFGVGGVNAHVILESPHQYGLAMRGRALSTFDTGDIDESSHLDISIKQSGASSSEPQQEEHLLLFSANSTTSLEGQIDAHQAYTQRVKASPKDLAYTLANRRMHREHRAYAIAGKSSTLKASSPETLKSSTPEVCWVFTGQGAQWAEMGVDLIESNPIFARTIRRLDHFLTSLPTPPPWTVESELRKTEGSSLVHRAEMGHPLTLAVQIGLIDVLRAYGIKPDFVLGHSSGEMGAAYASGSITAEGAMAAATFRGASNVAVSREGGMAAIGLGRKEVLPYLEEGVTIACENSQLSVTLSGDLLPLKRVVERIKKEREGVLARFLKVEKAFHSYHMAEHGPAYAEHIAPFIDSLDPPIPFYSAVTGARLTGKGCLGPNYWRENMEQPVLFNSSFRAALADHPGAVTMIEVGPHPALAGPIGQILRDIGRSDNVTHVATLKRGAPGGESLLHLAGKLFQQGNDLDLENVCPPGRFVTDLPRYAWKHEETSHFWAESRLASEWRFRAHPPHELLGSRVIESGGVPCWRNMLTLADVPWLAGHEVNGATVFPGAGYVSMVGEALKQLEGGDGAYTLKNVSILSALMLESDAVVEMATSLKPMAIDSADQSPAFEFLISSFNGDKWVRHCSGEASLSTETPVAIEALAKVETLPRKVDDGEWYDVLERIGFNYTGVFRGMTGITSATTAHQAAATVPALAEKDRGNFAVHPAIIDQCFHLFTVAAYRGLGRNCKDLAVPTFIEELVISPMSDDLRVAANINSLERGAFHGDLLAQSGGKTIFALKGFKSSALSGDEGPEEAPLFTQFAWKPHSDLNDLATYVRPEQGRSDEWALLEELALLCMLDHQSQLKLTEGAPEHLTRFLKSIQANIDQYAAGANKFVPKNKRLGALSTEQRMARIEEILARVSTGQFASLGSAIGRLFEASAAIFAGEMNASEVLAVDDLYDEVCEMRDGLDYSAAIKIVAHTNPHLRVLEVGAGKGKNTSKVLKSLQSSYGKRSYRSYTFSDASAELIEAAQETFADVEGMHFAEFDISRDPSEQEIEAGSFDLIIAANAVHNTVSTSASLQYFRSLLSPGGRIFLLEQCAEAKFMDYISGFLPESWSDESTQSQAYRSADEWSKELVAAGFEHPEAVVFDGPAPYHISAGIIASASNRKTRPAGITLLCHGPAAPYVKEVTARLSALDIPVETRTLSDDLPPYQDVISLLDLQDPTIHGMSEETFKSIVRQFKAFGTDNRLIWVTRSCQVNCEDPRAAMILGLARTSRNELSLKMLTVEIDTKTPRDAGASALADILLRANSPSVDREEMDPDWEYAIVDGEVLVPRLHWQTMSGAFESSVDGAASASKQLTIKIPGLLHTMGWSDTKQNSLAPGEVLVKTKAVGLNFRDVLIALGVLDNSTSEVGLEGCGIVQAVGPGVQKVSPGDRVMYMAKGCFKTFATLHEDTCVKLDGSTSFEQGAGLPCVYATATMALVDKANLQKGQTILIHSACGGVGLAAIQIAQMLEADIYCTAGSEAKIQYLMSNHGIPRSRILNSRDASFQKDIMRATNHRGVDVVLNSLSGDLLYASWACVADFGTMIEIGKRDFRRRSKLSLEAFEQNRTFVGLDLWQVSQVQPKKAAELLQRCVGWIRSGAIKPGAIANSFTAANVQDAFRFMQGGKHIGKIVITMPEDPMSLQSISSKPEPVLRQDRSYLLVGGLGGLGRAVATWMVEHGARSLVFLSRSARETPELKAFLDDVRSQDCQVQLIAGSVSNLADVKRAVKTAVKPVAGVINMSMVLRDISLSDMTFSDWTAAVAPKVQGTWNLHAACPSNLDFFILYSSYSGIAGQWGQANYGAANTFLDAFVQYRHREGRTASVIDVGVMGEVGFVSKNKGVLDHFQKTGMHVLREQDLLDAMTIAIQRSTPGSGGVSTEAHEYRNPSQILMGVHTTVDINSPACRIVWKHDARMSMYHNLSNGSGGDDAAAGKGGGQNSLKALAADAAGADGNEEQVTAGIAGALGTALANFLIREEGSIPLTDKSLEAIGVDSLVAMEVRNWIRQQLGVETSVFAIVQSKSVTALAETIRGLLAAKAKA